MKFSTATILSIALLVLAGCSSGSSTPSGTVSGKVTYNGEPVTEGTVLFVSTGETPPAEAQIQSDGTYKVTTPTGGLPLGDYRVAVTPPMVEIPPTAQSPGGVEPKKMDNIPPRYRDAGKSELTVTVKEGPQNFDIQMMPQK